MYRFDKRIYRYKKNKYIIFIIIFIVIALLIGYILIRLSKPISHVQQSKPVISFYNPPVSKNKTVIEPDFTFTLPKSWRMVPIHSTLYNIYQFESTSGASQILDIYQNTIPSKLPVNRELVVQANGSKLNTVGSVSSNCIDFTKPVGNSSGGVSARWQGINFLCDMANYERDVVGTGSSYGINDVVLSSPTLGKQQFFFTFTDYSINPTFKVLYQVINSFSLK